ncbi:MAG: hypothetical protein K0U36_02830, partial [Alphaproteobacteria bacterium]|nr:hypothetical protein [Alphaproteobacteria bacterium]
VMISTREDLVVYYRAYSINVHDGMYRKGQTKHQTFLHVLEPKEYKTIERTTNNDYDLLELILYENESLHNLKRVSDQQSLQQQAPVACKTNKTQDDSIIIIMDVDEKGEVTTQDVPNAVLRIGTSQTPDPVAEETGSEEKPEVSYADVEGDTLAEEMTDYQLIVKLRDILHEAIDNDDNVPFTYFDLKNFMKENQRDTRDMDQAFNLCDAARVLFIREYLPELIHDEAAAFALAQKASNILPCKLDTSHYLNSLSDAATPLHYALCAACALEVKQGETYLDTSAGVGTLAIFVEIMGGNLVLNERDPHRHSLLEQLFPNAVITQLDGEYDIFEDARNEHVDGIIINPPFTSETEKLPSMQWMTPYRHIDRAMRYGKWAARMVVITRRDVVLTKKEAYSIDVPGDMYNKYTTGYETTLHVLEPTQDSYGKIAIDYIAEKETDVLRLVLYANKSFAQQRNKAADTSKKKQAHGGGNIEDTSPLIVMSIGKGGDIATKGFGSSAPVCAEERPETIPLEQKPLTDYQLMERLAVMLHEGIKNSRKLTNPALKAFMTEHRGEDWRWQQAYELCEGAQVLFARAYMPELISDKVAAYLLAETASAVMPTQIINEERKKQFQQFSTPLHYALCAAYAPRCERGIDLPRAKRGSRPACYLRGNHGGEACHERITPCPLRPAVPIVSQCHYHQ